MFPARRRDVRVRWVTLRSGLRLRIAESGEPGRPAVLLLHGWAASVYMWREWFDPLARAGYHAIAVDLPGHGLADKPADPSVYRLSSLVETVREVAQMEASPAVDVVAQSMAGTIAIELARDPASPVRRLALVNPACFGLVRLQPLARLVSPSIVDVVLPQLVTRWLVSQAHRMVYGDPSRITERDEDEYWAPSQFPSYARAMRLLVHQFPWSRPPVREMAARLRGLREAPLVILGTRDRLVLGAKRYTEMLREAGVLLDVREVAGGGHAVNEERPDVVMPLVLEFLRHV